MLACSHCSRALLPKRSAQSIALLPHRQTSSTHNRLRRIDSRAQVNAQADMYSEAASFDGKERLERGFAAQSITRMTWRRR